MSIHFPRIEDILDRLARAKYFSTADVSSAYWQVPIHPDSRPLLAFATIDGLYQPTRLPFGLKTSPQIYERAINQVLQGHGLDCVAHYFDDFVIYSETLEEHQEHLRRFFAFCDAENLQLNLTKCEFFRQTIEFLGYTITAGEIIGEISKPSLERAKSNSNLPTFTNTRRSPPLSAASTLQKPSAGADVTSFPITDTVARLLEFHPDEPDPPINFSITVFWIVFDFYLLKKMDQRTCIKFCVKNEIKCADAFRLLTVAYGEATLDRSNVYRWYKMFSEGREDVNDEERAGRPSTSTTDEKINEVEKMILANRRITVREVDEDLNISIGSCHSIFINDLGMRRVAAKFVPKLLNYDQKQHRMNIANEMLDSVRDDPNLLQRVITGDEAWVYCYDVETKAQSSQWKLPHEPRPKKARQVRSNVKVLLTVFFDCRGVVHHEFFSQGRTVNKEYYLQIMCNLREAIRQKRPDL
ncbi:hypothetical protein LAZ67_1003885 [Cordylochernes scorpioides]|uniref:Reverse transcriptase domain-containing protein n=1 Tax=Cordylochernes scorpioides TaxID=51811 RepID=A0ABY6JYV6_9ARAC|nr:hypothetical protein LAZ67_1003885 [Cordylochernes scorpioides]